MLKIQEDQINHTSIAFCSSFAEAARPRFLLGRNEYTRSIACVVDVNGIIDDFTDEKEFQGKPVVKMKDVPGDGLVVSCVIGRPRTAARALDALDLNHLDYFAFARYSGLGIMPISFWEGLIGILKNTTTSTAGFMTLCATRSQGIPSPRLFIFVSKKTFGI